LAPIITHETPLEDVQQTFTKLERYQDGMAKVVLKTELKRGRPGSSPYRRIEMARAARSRSVANSSSVRAAGGGRTDRRSKYRQPPRTPSTKIG